MGPRDGGSVEGVDDIIQENESLKKRLTELTAEAANNESILKRTQSRELSLLRADGLPQLLHALVEGLKESYSLDAVSVVLLDPQHEIRHLLVAGGDRPEEFKQIFFVDSLDQPGAAARRPAQALARALRRSGSSSAFPGPSEPEKRGPGAVAPQGSCHRRAVLRQPGPYPIHAPPRHRLPLAPGRGRRRLHRERRQPGPAAARGHHRFPDRVAQPPVFAAALEGGARARSAQGRHHRLPDDGHRSLQGNQRRLRTPGGRHRSQGDRAARRIADSQHGHGRALRRRRARRSCCPKPAPPRPRSSPSASANASPHSRSRSRRRSSAP